MRQYLYTSFSKTLVIGLLVAVSLESCTEDSIYVASGIDPNKCEVVNMPIKVSAVELEDGLGTRSVDESLVNEGDSLDNTIKDIWILQYDEKGGKSAEPVYIDNVENLETGLSVPIVRPKGNLKYKIIVIGNTHNPSLETMLKRFFKTSNLSGLVGDFTCQESGYNAPTPGKSKGDMLLNGWQTITSKTETLDVSLFRTMAKVTVTVKLAKDSGVKVKSFQLKNIPSKYCLVDQYVEYDPAVTFADNGRLDLPIENWTEGSESMTFVYYIPRNMRGETGADNEKTKNYSAPSGATYIEILGNTSDGDPMRLKFYLGKNMTNNFDVEPNHHYNLPIEIKSMSNVAADSRVEIIKGKTFNDANSFIINIFPSEGLGQAKYTIPITRINTYWQNPNDGDAKYAIGDEDEWIAEVVWQDCDDIDMFHFVNQDGTEKASQPHFYEGKGCTSFCIRPTGKTSGNALIGVRRKDRSSEYPYYSWTWHLWFTDYDPAGVMTSGSGAYVFNVPGGHLYRYNTKYWNEHQTSFMMDRNLGSWYNSYNEASEQSTDARYFGLYFQCGRKEPMPIRSTNNSLSSTIKKYKLNQDGSEYVDTVKFTMKPGYGTIKEAIHNPTVYYHNSGDNHRWCSDDKDSSHTWDLIEWNKKLLDPSPEGWSIPRDGDPFVFGTTLEKGNDYGNLRIYKFTDCGHCVPFQLGYPSFRTSPYFMKLTGGDTNIYLALAGVMPDGKQKKIAKMFPTSLDFFESNWVVGDNMPVRLITDPDQ